MIGLFNRRRGAVLHERDEALPDLSVGQATRLRRLAVKALSRLDYRPIPDGDTIGVGNGRVFPLTSLSRLVALAPERHWKPLVRQHFAALAAAARAARIEDLEPTELLRLVRVKIFAPAALDTLPDEFRYGLDQSGLRLLAVADCGSSLSYLRDRDMDRLGHDTVWSAAITNFFSLGVGRPEQLESRDGAFFCLESGSTFQATWLAFPDELFARLGFTVGIQGALLTAPASSIINIHVVGEGTSTGDLDFLLGVTQQQYNSHPSPFSPHLYWWDGFDVHQVSTLKDERLSIRLPETLEGVLSL